jgi:hypothetical protein
MANAAELIKHLMLVIRVHQASLANKSYEVVVAAMQAVADGPLGKLAPMASEQRRQEIKQAIARDQSEIGVLAVGAISQLETISTDLRQQLNTRINCRLQEMRDNPDSWGQE